MGLRLQAALLVALLIGSLGTLGLNVFAARVPAQQEHAVRERLRAASSRMASAAAHVTMPARLSNGAFATLNRELTAVTAEVLAKYPEIEGGFYLGGDDRFAGYAFPTHVHPRPDRQTDPPPLEAPYIRVQAQESLTIPAGEVRLTVRDVEASRVMMLTEPVGTSRPAAAATWLMYRLVDPKQLGTQVRRYQASTGLAIAGSGIGVLLLLNLGRLLRRQRIEQSQLREELRRAEHLAALGKLLAGVAHEVRNPLAAIRSTVQLWERLPEQARTPASLEAVIQAVDRLNHTVTQLLQFSRADQAQREPVPVDALLRETLDLFAAQAALQQVGIECNFAAAPAVFGSASALRQVFANLVQNALQAMPRGGQLRVHTQFHAHAAELEIVVADTGPGVTPADQAHLFEPFFTTRSSGTGLGLALCREIVEHHRGKIEYVADAHPGATFRILLPVSQHLR